jgi:SAM-dependent methyltransferase
VQLSFRDPEGFVFRSSDRILRCVFPRAADNLRSFLSSPIAVKWMASRMLCPATVLKEPPGVELLSGLDEREREGAIFLEHEPIAFPNYPYEWAPGMLHAAAALTLRLAQGAREAGFELKDATPYNIMFDGPEPVFLDVLSFAARDPLEALWWPYAQFVRTFVYPLLAVRLFGLRLDELLLTHRDGLEPERVLRLCPPLQRWLPPFLGAVTIPALLSDKDAAGNPDRFRGRRARDSKEADFLVRRAFARAGRLLGAPPAPARRSPASRYMDDGHCYTAPQLQAKENAVAEALQSCHAASVLDIGCNTGHFSHLAARFAPIVVAIDLDPDALELLWSSARERHVNILPLVIDIARPPGGCGWANRECPSFLDRARGKFDCVLMLALIHHLLMHERIPLDNILDAAADMTRHLVVIEYVDPSDAQFQRIARGREPVRPNLTTSAFESAATHRFVIVSSREITPTRRIYTLRKRVV